MDINYYKKFEPIDGKWYITKELGNGAYGTVFEIQRKDFTDMKSALKIISIPSNQNEVDSYRDENFDLDDKSVTAYFYGFVEEFVKEFRLMSQLKGKSNIVSYEDHDVIKKADGIGWDIFIRMELLIPMNKYFASNMPKESDVIKLGIDICKALEVCQKYKIIHRDIKPSNIFVSDTCDFKLGDFGVARTLEKTSSGLSKKGTYTYMAPEVYKGQPYGSNVDIYSLGIVMYKLLNNNLEPFRKDRTYSDGERALEMRLLGNEIPKPANVEGRLAEIVLKACAFDPKDRYESPLQMRQELENIQYNDKERNVIFPGGDEIVYEPTDGVIQEKTVIDEQMKAEDATEGVFKSEAVKDFNIGILKSKEKMEFNDIQFESIIENEETETKHSFAFFVQSYVNFWKRYIDFKGCTSRNEYWAFIGANVCIYMIIFLIIWISQGVLVPLYSIYCLSTIVPSLAICTRRLHDTGRSGHWQWLYLTVYGSIVVFIFLLFKSRYNQNKYRL